MKKIIIFLIFLSLTSCNLRSKEGSIKPIDSLREEERSKIDIIKKEIEIKSPTLKEEIFKARKLDYTIIKPDFLLKERFKNIKIQDKYALMMMEYFDKEEMTFYVNRILSLAIEDSDVYLEKDFDDKMDFIIDLFLLSPFYSKGETEPYIYDNYIFNEETFTILPRLNSDKDTKTYITHDERDLIDSQIKILVDYANENYDNDYDKAYYFARWLAENNEYQYTGDDELKIDNNMYGALIKGLSQCSGFSQSFTILCEEVGIPTYSITGNTESKFRSKGYSAEHQWNIIKLNDNWSYVDITGMVVNGSNYYFYYFDRSKEEFVNYYVSEFFNNIEEYIR